MASVSGTYKESNIADIAAAIVLLDAHLDIEEASLTGTSALISGTLTLTVGAENASNVRFNHKITTTLNCASVADAKTMTAALSVFATAVVTESDYNSVVAVDISMSSTFST